MSTPPQGFVKPGFEEVSEAFAANFSSHGEVGAAFAVVHRGELVVDLWGGLASRRTGRPWREDTLQLFYSGTKGLIAACVLICVERGLLDLEAPVARYWPEFARHGKGAVTVGDVMSHQARLPGLRQLIDPDEVLFPVRMAAMLADQPQETDPRAEFIYHTLTYGWLAAELIRRVDGRGSGRFIADEIAGPLGLELWLGLPAEQHHRVADVIYGPGMAISPNAEPPADELVWRVQHNPPPFVIGTRPWEKAHYLSGELPAGGAIGTARSMARFYGCLAMGGELDGVRILKESTVELGRRERRRGPAHLWGGVPFAYATGFEVQTELATMGPAADAFGHSGAGGSRHGAWPGHRVGFSYAMNELRAAYPELRPLRLLSALHRALSA